MVDSVATVAPLYKSRASAVSSDYYARGSTRIVLRSDAASGDRLSLHQGGHCMSPSLSMTSLS